MEQAVSVLNSRKQRLALFLWCLMSAIALEVQRELRHRVHSKAWRGSTRRTPHLCL